MTSPISTLHLRGQSQTLTSVLIFTVTFHFSSPYPHSLFRDPSMPLHSCPSQCLSFPFCSITLLFSAHRLLSADISAFPSHYASACYQSADRRSTTIPVSSGRIQTYPQRFTKLPTKSRKKRTPLPTTHSLERFQNLTVYDE